MEVVIFKILNLCEQVFQLPPETISANSKFTCYHKLRIMATAFHAFLSFFSTLKVQYAQPPYSWVTHDNNIRTIHSFLVLCLITLQDDSPIHTIKTSLTFMTNKYPGNYRCKYFTHFDWKEKKNSILLPVYWWLYESKAIYICIWTK